jgi:TonB family protein
MFKTLLRSLVVVVAVLTAQHLVAQTATTPTPMTLKADQVDQQPTFGTHADDLAKYLATAVQYPPTARRDRAQNTIVVAFTVKPDGSLTSIYHAGDPEIDNRLIGEALRVIKAMPNWNPAVHKGEEVACEVKVPIKFKLD